jgi:hypothetical protein
MNRHNVVRKMLIVFALALAVAAVPAASYAVTGPTLVPHQIVSEGFETAPPSDLTLDWMLSAGYPTSAYWGRITQQKRSGSYGLWCAGSIPRSAATNTWVTFGGFYPSYTAGLADFSLPDLADYYSATLDYWYRMPSIGSEDGDSLNVLWQPASNGGALQWDHHTGWATTSTWTHVALDLTAAAPQLYNLSRTAATVRFQFVDSAGSAGESPTNGEGPTIDDVAVTGYEYGPVRGLGVTVDGVGAHLSWTVPARSTVPGAADDDRSIAYRVYRELDGSNAWAELTPTRVVGTTFDDTDTSALAGTYRYVVQAWDTGAGAGYGQVTLAGDTTTHFFAGPPSAPQFTITGIPSGPTKSPVTPSYTVTSVETAGPTVAATLDGSPFAMGGPVSAEGTHTLIVRLTGSGGIGERSAVFVIDHTVPSTTNNLPAAGAISLTPVMIVLNAKDNVSGVAYTKYSLDGAATFSVYTGGVLVTAWRDHTINYYSVDLAGNIEPQHHIHFSMRQPTSLSIASATLKPMRGHAISLSGYLAPAAARYKLTLKYQKPGSSKWYSVTRSTVKAGSRGKWSYRYTPAKKGTYHFKISYAGSTTKRGSNSSVIAIRVR